MSTVEDLWRKLEIRKPSSRRGREDRSEGSDRTGGTSTCESQGTEEEEFSDDPFAIHPDGDLGDCDRELELINLNNTRSSREFSLSGYDVGVRHVQRTMVYDDELDHSGDLGDALDGYRSYSNRVDVINDGDVISTDGADSGHVICDCDDCINQTEAVECHCENCVRTRGVTLHSPHTSSPREVNCDCEECLNHSGDSYVCSCQNCVEANQLTSRRLNHNNNHPDDLCKCAECSDQGRQHQQEMCNCSKCATELQSLEQGLEHMNLSPGHNTRNYANEFQPIHTHNGLSKTVHKPVYIIAKTDNINIDNGANFPGNVQSDDVGYYINASDHVRYGDDGQNVSEGSLEGVDFIHEDLHEDYVEDCDCKACCEQLLSQHDSLQQSGASDISA